MCRDTLHGTGYSPASQRQQKRKILIIFTCFHVLVSLLSDSEKKKNSWSFVHWLFGVNQCSNLIVAISIFVLEWNWKPEQLKMELSKGVILKKKNKGGNYFIRIFEFFYNKL